MSNKIYQLLNEMLSVYWMATVQHQSHIAVIRAEGATKLAKEMEEKTADEPENIVNLQNRLLDLGGTLQINLSQPNIGKTLREALENDYELQKNARAGLNTWAELAAAEHDATTRNLIERMLEDEEEHLAWLEQELHLLDKLGEALYLAKRM